MRRWIAIGGLMLLLVAGCGDDAGSTASEQQDFDIVGSWSFEQVYLDGMPEGLFGPGWPDKSRQIRFDEQGYFWGHGLCNDYQAEYVFENGAIGISFLSASAVLCLDERADMDDLLLEVFRPGRIEVLFTDEGFGMEWWFDGGRAVLTRVEQ